MTVRIKISVTNRVSTITENTPLFSGSRGDSIFFSFDSEWNAYATKRVIFYRDKEHPVIATAYVTNNSVTIPREIIDIPGPLYFGVFAQDSGNHRISSNILQTQIYKGIN